MLVALLLVLALIIWGVWAAVGAIFGGSDDEEDDPTPTESSTESASETSSDDATTAQVAPGGDPVDCVTEDLEVSMEPSGRYAGTPVTFAISVTNTGQLDCLVDAGLSQMVVTVSSGNDAVWSSAHCAPDDSRMLLLGPDGSSDSEVEWPGTRSSEGCPEDAAPVTPGTYRAAITVDGVEWADAARVFTLEEAPPPETPSDGEESPSDAAG
ncbi:hypothetical protein CZ771_07075 [Actinomycetales bacterium JB111]|nr:hypothetical protein CZ771_07075 [Actinomycetales bacterium JB111]